MNDINIKSSSSEKPQKSVVQTIRAGYKKTEVGVIPEDWEVRELGDILTFGSGRDYKHLSIGEIPVYGTGGIMTYVDEYLFDGESVGIGRKGTIDKPVFLNGKFWTVDTLFYTHQFLNSNPKFIYYKFCLIKWKEYNEASGVPSLNKNTLQRIKLSLPTKAEQTAIATALSDADALINSIEKLIAKKRNIKRGAMQQLMSELGFARLKDKQDFNNQKNQVNAQYQNPENLVNPINPDSDKWEVKKLGEICETLGSGKSKTQSQEGKFPIYGSTGIIGWSNTFDYSGHKILVARVGANAGTVNIVEGNYCVSDNTLMVSLKSNIDLNFIYNFLVLFQLNKLVFGSGQPLITGGQLKNIEVAFPTAKAEQTRIATILSDMDAEISSLEAKLEKYKKIKLGMMQNLLTGKIRLV